MKSGCRNCPVRNCVNDPDWVKCGGRKHFWNTTYLRIEKEDWSFDLCGADTGGDYGRSGSSCRFAAYHCECGSVNKCKLNSNPFARLATGRCTFATTNYTKTASIPRTRRTRTVNAETAALLAQMLTLLKKSIDCHYLLVFAC